jgi:hypothetical protein
VSVPLPPLPPDFGAPIGPPQPAGRSVVDLLEAEHRQFAELCAELTAADTEPGRRGRVRDVLAAAVSRHLSAEEQYFLPAIRAALPDGGELADGELAVDQAVLRLVKQLATVDPADPAFADRAAELTALLGRHEHAARQRLLPGLVEAASDAELIRLGNRVEIAAEAAPTRPHPATPATPPWNKMVDPAVGMVDKVRDLVARRHTYPTDL